MKFIKLLFSRFVIVSLLIIIQIAVTFSFWYYLQNRYLGVSIAVSILSVLVSLSIMGRDQSAAYKLPWIVIISIVPFGGIILFVLFGRLKLSRRSISKIRDVYEVTQNAIQEPDVELRSSQAFGQSTYILNACKLPAYAKSKTEYLPSGEIYFERLIEELKTAKKYIFLEYFIIANGSLWDRIHEVLLQKVKENVEVYVLYDDIGSISKVPRTFYKALRKEGIHAQVFNKFVPIASVVHNNRDHRKIAVIDGETAFTGGANIADEYTNEIELYGKWKDSGIVIKGNAVDSFVVLFLQNYNIMAYNQLHIDDYINKNHTYYDEPGFVQPYGDGPHPIFSDYVGRDIYLNVINQAKKYLYITTPYLIVEYSMIEALINAKKRGVDVKIMTPHIPDKKAIFIMTRSSYAPLLKEGIEIYEYEPGFIHAKSFVCDDDYGVVGTVNLDYRSFVHHYECGAWLYKTNAVKQIKEDFISMVKNESIAIDEKNSKLNVFQKLIRNLLNFFAPLL